MKLEESYHFQKYYKIIKYTIITIGEWPYQSVKSAKICSVLFFYCLLSSIISTIATLVERFHTDMFVETMTLLLFSMMVLIKYINFTYKRKNIKNIFDCIEEDWNGLNNEAEIEILSKHYLRGKLMCTTYFYLLTTLGVIYLFVPLYPYVLDIIQPLNESRPREPKPLINFFMDENDYAISIMIHFSVSTITSVIAICASDMLFTSYVRHTCGMFAVLRYQLENINITNDYDGKLPKNYHEKLRHCITRHQNIINECDKINAIYSDSFFFIMSVNLILISLTGVTAVLKSDKFEMLRMTLVTIGESVHLLYYCVQGQNLMDQNEIILDCIYDLEWYNASTQTKKLLIMMMMRCSKPCTLTAKIYILFLPTFTMVMKTAMSYFTVVKSQSD